MPAISGIVKDATGTPCAALVRVIRRADMSLVGQVFSDPSTGAYSVTTADTTPHVVERFVAPAEDPYFGNTVSLIHFSTAAGFVDVLGNSLTAGGGAAITTTRGIFGSGSSLLLDGTGDYVYTAKNPKFAYGTGDFTDEIQVYPTAYGTSTYSDFGGALIDQRISGTSTNGYGLFLTTSGKLKVWSYALLGTSTLTVPLNAWSHIAMCRSGGELRVYLNGVRAITVTEARNITDNLRTLGSAVDVIDTSTHFKVVGSLAEFRSTAFARYTADFSATLPSATFADFLIGTPTENAQIFDNVIPV